MSRLCCTQLFPENLKRCEGKSDYPSRDLVKEILNDRIDRFNDIVRLLKFLEGIFSFNNPIEVATFHLLTKSVELALRMAESIGILAKLQSCGSPSRIIDISFPGNPGARRSTLKSD